MSNKYFIVVAKERYDCNYQDMEYLGIFDCFSLAKEHITSHDKQFYVYGLREFDYFIFTSNINEKIIMKEEDCIYSLTARMYHKEDDIEYVKEEYKQYLNKEANKV